MLTLYDAARCPFCARVRIVLAEKGVPYEAVEIDLSDRPAWLYEKNPLGKVPVLEEDGWLLPESAVIDEFLNERYPEPPLWPADPGERAAARLLVLRFDAFSEAYYAFRRDRNGGRAAFDEELAALNALLRRMPYLTGRDFGLEPVRVQLDLDPLPGEQGLDQLVESGRHDEGLETPRQLGEPLAHARMLDEEALDLGERRPHRLELERDHLVQRQLPPERALRLQVDLRVAELEQDHVERVHLGDGSVPVEHEAHLVSLPGLRLLARRPRHRGPGGATMAA